MTSGPESESNESATHSAAYRYLELKQRRALEDRGQVPGEWDAKMAAQADQAMHRYVADGRLGQADAEAWRDKLLAHLLATPKPPSKYEDRAFWSMTLDMFRQIEEAGVDIGIPLSNRPLVGTLQTGQVNAVTIRVPNSSEYIVALHEELFTFALLLSKAVGRSFLITDPEGGNFSAKPEDVAKRADAEPSIVGRFFDVVRAYAITGHPAAAAQYHVEPAYEAIATILRDSMEIFVLSHEYGHVVLRHLEDAPLGVAALDSGAETTVEYDSIQEFAADYIAVALCLSARAKVSRIDHALAYMGAELYFDAIDVVERAVSLLDHGDETAIVIGSHPPASMRREFLRAQLPRLLGEERALPVREAGIMIETTVNFLFDRCKPQFLALHAKGVRADPTWQRRLAST